MGIFDRLRSAAPSRTRDGKPDTAEQDATRLIDQGHALEAQGKLDEAMQCYLEAIRHAPNPARGHLNRGNVLLLQGDLDGALDAFRTALVHQPDYAGAYYNIGNALLGNRQLDEAVASYRSALRINPDYAEVHCSLGVALKELGQVDEAVDCFKTALAIKPDFFEAHFNQGLALQANSRFDDGMTCYLRALEINPDFAEAHFHLGNGLQVLRHFNSAVDCYHRALKIKPDYTEAHIQLGIAWNAIGEFDIAIECYRHALAIKPNLAVAHINLGNTLLAIGQSKSAAANYQQALESDPDNAEYRVTQAFSLPAAPQTVATSLAVPAEFDHALQELSDWLLSSPACKVHFSEAVGLKQPFYLAYRDGNHVALLSRYGDMVAPNHVQIPITFLPKREKIRLVIVSNYFYRHSVWDILIKGVLSNLDRTRFEVVIYYTDRSEDEETKIAKSLSDVWRDPRTIMSKNGWLGAMAEDQPDVIFYPEIGMDIMTLRLAARRLAPLQVAGWGHPITTGLPTIDLFFSGELLEAPDADGHYRERLVRLPGTGCCTTPLELKPEGIPEIELELAKRPGVRFVIAQMIFKFEPADDALFADIAATAGECTFILLSTPKYSFAMDQLITRLKQTFYERNLDPEKHLLVFPWLSREKFYALLDLCDIYLDCPSFSGYTTAWQAVHHGLPVVTLEGQFMRQRLAAGLLHKIGMTDTIAASKAEYVAIATRLAAECLDPVRRAARRNELKAAAPRADHDVSVVRSFEQSVINALAERGRHFELGDGEQHHSLSSNQGQS